MGNHESTLSILAENGKLKSKNEKLKLMLHVIKIQKIKMKKSQNPFNIFCVKIYFVGPIFGGTYRKVNF